MWACRRHFPALAIALAVVGLACSAATDVPPPDHPDHPAGPTAPPGSVAVVFTAITTEGGSSHTSMYRTYADSAVTATLGVGDTPAWSPDHTELVFVGRDSSGQSDVYIMDSTGAHRRQLTNDAALESYPDWSPDGKAVVYTAPLAGTADHRTALYIAQVDGSGSRLLVADSAASVREASWSPDGQLIAFVRDSGQAHARTLWTVHDDGSNAQQLGSVTGVYQPEWSPDQHWIAMGWQPSGASQGIAVMPADGSAPPTTLATSGGWPAWSPDGTRLLFVRGGGPNGPELWTVDADGTDAAQLHGTLANWGDW